MKDLPIKNVAEDYDLSVERHCVPNQYVILHGGVGKEHCDVVGYLTFVPESGFFSESKHGPIDVDACMHVGIYAMLDAMIDSYNFGRLGEPLSEKAVDEMWEEGVED